MAIESGGIAELANVATVHPRDLGSSFGIDKKIFSYSICLIRISPISCQVGVDINSYVLAANDNTNLNSTKIKFLFSELELGCVAFAFKIEAKQVNFRISIWITCCSNFSLSKHGLSQRFFQE
jgi:hypothetical protein